MPSRRDDFILAATGGAIDDYFFNKARGAAAAHDTPRALIMVAGQDFMVAAVRERVTIMMI